MIKKNLLPALFLFGIIFTTANLKAESEALLQIDSCSEAYLLRDNHEMGKRELSPADYQHVLDYIYYNCHD